jgi:hypothetical protein
MTDYKPMKYNKKILFGSIVAVLLLVVVLLTYSNMNGLSNERGLMAQNKSDGENTYGASEDSATDSITDEFGSDMDNNKTMQKEDVIATLKNLYTEGIYHPRVQLEAIESLVRYLKKMYPNDWESHVWEYLAAAFPDYANELFSNYKKLVFYKQWIKDNFAMLTGLPRDRMNELMWDKRKAFFGNDALKIWELELKQKEVKDVLAEIQDETNLPFDKKTDFYRHQLEAIYGDISEAFIKAHQQKMMNQFLEVASVQDDLANMQKAERQKNLTEFRKSMGLDEDAIKRWDQLDATRDARWANGLAYMKAREQIINKNTGEDQSQSLNKLRQHYFGAEAETIAREEMSQFYRFNRPREYGKN